MDGLNYGTYYFFRSLARETPVLRGAMCGIDFLGTLPVLGVITLIVLGAMVSQGNRRGALVVALTAVVGLLLIEGVNRLTDNSRPPEPDVSYAGVALGPSMVSRTGFLSVFVYGVPMLTLAGAASTWTKRIATFAAYWLLVLPIGFSQLFLSLEFLTALLAGWAAGMFALLVWSQLAPLATPLPR
jgi:membrane-associated phospholipid phosphatase